MTDYTRFTIAALAAVFTSIAIASAFTPEPVTAIQLYGGPCERAAALHKLEQTVFLWGLETAHLKDSVDTFIASN